MIPNHDDAVNAALLAIAKAFQAGKPGQEEWPAESVEERARFILQELGNEGQREGHVATVEDRAEAVSLPVAVVVRLMLDAMKVPGLVEGKNAMVAELRAVHELFRSARKIMNGRRLSHDKRQRKALFELGLIGEKGGAGAARVNHRRIADHYFALRRGDPKVRWEGEVLTPHSHNEAVQVIFDRHGIDWDALLRSCRNKGIKVRTEAEVFPIK